MKKIDTVDFIIVKNVCSVEDIVKRIKRQVTAWEKIFAKRTSKELYPEQSKDTAVGKQTYEKVGKIS